MRTRFKSVLSLILIIVKFLLKAYFCSRRIQLFALSNFSPAYENDRYVFDRA